MALIAVASILGALVGLVVGIVGAVADAVRDRRFYEEHGIR